MKTRILFLSLTLALAGFSTLVVAEEGGTGHYLPGSMASFVDGVPAEETIIARYNFLYYGGGISRSRPLPIAGLTALGADASSYANGLTMLWRPPIEFGNNLSYAMSATVPYVSIDVTADIGPFSRTDSAEDFGDIVIMPLMFNYKFSDDFNIDARLGIYAPTGEYEVGRLANTGKNFWTYEPALGFMYFGQQNGIEASVFTGFDINTENSETNYKSGTQMHVDGTLAQHFPIPGGLMGIGVNGFWYEQVTGDSGSGATLGDFKSRTAGIGPVLSYTTKVHDVDVIAELKWLSELETRNRLEGDYIWFKLVVKF